MKKMKTLRKERIYNLFQKLYFSLIFSYTYLIRSRSDRQIFIELPTILMYPLKGYLGLSAARGS